MKSKEENNFKFVMYLHICDDKVILKVLLKVRGGGQLKIVVAQTNNEW